MRAILSALVLVALSILVSAENYDGYKVVRAYVEDAKQIAVISEWELDVWSRDSSLAVGANDMMVNATHTQNLDKMYIKYDTLIESVEEYLEQGARDLALSRSNATLADFFTAYHTYAEYVQYFQSLASSYSSIVTYVPAAATTIQNRNIPAVVVTGNKGSANKKKIFISGGQHAREWVAPATVTCIITQLATLYGSNSQVTALLDSTIIHFIPMVNPDGYFFTWQSTANRLWRKNRRANTGGSYGVDLNRNWDDHWGGAGSSGSPTSDTYRGTAAFSEPESKGVANYVTKNGPFKGAIDYHSYSQLILRPYGWTTAAPPNNALAKSVGESMKTAIYNVNRVSYTNEASWELYYTTGSAQDWYYSEASIPLSYTIELRDTGTYGFQLPASQIKPTGAENWAAFLVFANAAISN